MNGYLTENPEILTELTDTTEIWILFLEYQFQHEDLLWLYEWLALWLDRDDFLTSLISDMSGDSLPDELKPDIGLVLGGVYQLHNGNVLLVVFLDLQK